MAASSSAVRESRVLHLFLHAHLYRITGMWTWSLMTEAIFCSDVMFALSGDLIPEGTKTLMHPEDIQAVQTMIRQVKAGKAVHAEFRLITTYGNTETVQAAGLFECVEIDGFTAKLEHLAIEAQGAIKNSSDESRHLQTLAAAYQQSEKFFNFGAYYINITRLEVFYSDEVFKIHGIPAQSLNAHFHTFHSFIHPSDHEQAVHFLETGYKTQIPLELEYRIIVNGRETRYIAHTTRWTVNEKGDEILMGIIKDVTAQHRREQENQELRNQMMLSVKALQHAENFSRIGSFNLNVVTRKFEYSDQVYRMLGLRNTGILLNASTFLKYVHPDDQEKMAEVNRKMLLDQTAPDMEFRIIRPDGKTRYLRQKGKLIIDKNEEMVILGTIMDTTEKEIAAIRLHQLSHELHLQQLKLHHMEEVSGSAGWIWNTHTGDIQWSKGIYDLLGFKGMGVQMNQKLFMSFIHPEDKKLFSNSIASMLHGETASSFMFRISRKNEIRWIHADFRLETREDENYFSAIFQDRSEIVALRDEFTEHLQMLDLLMDSLNDCMFVTDLHHNILKWNRKSEIEFGIRKDKAVDQNLFDLLPHLKKKNILHAYQQANLGETAILPDERSSLNNAIETIRIHPVKDADGHVKAVFTLIHDQTGESQLRQQLTERLKFIEKLLQFSVDRIIVLDKKMNYLYWNRKAEQYYGIPQKEVVGRNILELFPGFIDDPSYTEFRKVLRGETVHIPAVRNLEDKKGYFETYLIPVKDDNEEVIAVLWIVHDLLSEYHLAQHQRKATHILQSINEAYVELDAEGKLRFVNAMAETLWKRPKEELLGFTLHEIFHDQISPDMLSGIQKALGSKSPCKGEYWMTNSQRWFYVSCTPSTDSMIMLFYDITEVKQARENLFLSQQLAREHQDMLAQTAIASPDAITIYDLEQRQPIYLNNCLSRWTGFSNEELVAMGYEGRLQLIHPEDRKRLEVFNEGLLSAEDQEVKIIEYRLKTPRGLFWIRNRGKVFRKDGQGKPTHVLSVLQDFSEEMKLREQLMERTRYAEAIIDASIDRIAVCDRNLHLIAWNQRSELATGFRKEYVMGRNISEILPEVLQERKIAEALEDARNGQYAYLPPMKTSFSSQLCERFYIPLEDEGGDVYAVLIIMHDVTDLVHKEDELRDLNRLLEHKNTELEQKHEEITNFAFVASHDLKEPLRKIHTFSDWLIQHEAEQLSSVGRNFIDKMMSAVRRMEMLIDDILVLTRIHSDVDRVEETDLNTVLSDVCADIHEWIEKSHTDISADPLPRIQANRNQVFYLFRNLVSNAIKFQRPGNVPRIRITADKVEKDAAGHQAEGGFLRISFSDNGFGFNPRYSRKIFQVFQKLHDKYEFEGTGIGLAICKKIMENHHGSITADSEIGKGSVFSCYFPLEPR